MKFFCRLLILLSTLLCAPALLSAEVIDLEQVYRELDEAILHSDEYVQVREGHITTLKNTLALARTPEAQLDACRRLYDEYKPYMNDSAIHYIDRCIDLANAMGDRGAANECALQLAFLCSETGMYHEAMEILNGIDATQLNEDGKQRYHGTMAHLYGEMAYYCRVPRLQRQYYAQRDHYNSLIDTVRRSNDEVLQFKELERYGAGDARGALHYSDLRLQQVDEQSHQFAIVAFYRHLDYRLLGDSVQARYWVTRSALNDVRNAVMDQGALWELANMLMADGDIDRAYRYIQFAWKCAYRFNTLKRNGQISPILSDISTRQEASLEHRGRLLMVLTVILSILAALFLAALFYSGRQRRRLAKAQRELSAEGARLEQLNARLQDLNARLQETNLKLNESHRVKDEYVGRFIHLCSFYIDRLDETRRRVGKMVKNRDFDALHRFSEGGELREKDLAELYGMFDSTFLHLFPDFVDQFNALLRPECRITLPEPGTLNTDLRIFALIRLGIDDSSRIAEFLHYSVNTIYNYRARVRNGAAGSRDTFEAQVKAIGM